MESTSFIMGMAQKFCCVRGPISCIRTWETAHPSRPALLIRFSNIVLHPSANHKRFPLFPFAVARQSGVLTSYPGQAGVYAVFRLGGGSASDIPEGVPEELRDMGWWAG